MQFVNLLKRVLIAILEIYFFGRAKGKYNQSRHILFRVHKVLIIMFSSLSFQCTVEIENRVKLLKTNSEHYWGLAL